MKRRERLQVGGLAVIGIAVAAVAYFTFISRLNPDRDTSAQENESVTETSQASSDRTNNQILPPVNAVKSVDPEIDQQAVIATNEIAAESSVTESLEPTAAEQLIIDKIDELLGEDQELKALQAARSLMSSPNPDVRIQAIDAFGWIGVKALPELSKMLFDKNREVAAEAFDNWESAVEDIEDENAQAVVLAAGVKSMTNQDDIDDAMMIFDTMEDHIAVPVIVDVIQNGTPIASKSAREQYEFTTGEVYTTPEAANKWVAEQIAEQE